MSGTPAGRVIVLPGIYNTRFHLAPFVAAARRQLPGFDIEVRRWGLPLLAPYNLLTHTRNRAVAADLAAEIAAWRTAHPAAPLYVVGYSGGGGLAVLMVASLPDDIAVDRLVLVAPAISPGFPLEAAVLPHVREFVANFASVKDLQVNWGTRTFGTIDRQWAESAGGVGFDLSHPKLVEWHWSGAARAQGHYGNHLSYLRRRWQEGVLLPALDPAIDVEALLARWSSSGPIRTR